MLGIKRDDVNEGHDGWIGPAPEIKTVVPGPEAKNWIERDEEHCSPSYTRDYPLVVKRAVGSVVEDVDGNRFLDFAAGIAVCATGHCHPKVVEAIEQQARSLIHICGSDFYYPVMSELMERLCGLVPGDRPKRVFLTNSGTEAVEAAIKLTRYHSKRKWIIAFHGAFHGRTMGYPVVDFKVELKDGQYHDVDSSEMSFKIAGSLGFKDAIAKCKPTLLEPIMEVETVVPEEYAGTVMGDLSSRRGRPQGMEPSGSMQVIKAQVPMAEMLTYDAELTSMTGGRGSYHMEMSHYDEVPGQLQEKVIQAARAERGEEQDHG